jgi:transcription termination/antitermination protein NusG
MDDTNNKQQATSNKQQETQVAPSKKLDVSSQKSEVVDAAEEVAKDKDTAINEAIKVVEEASAISEETPQDKDNAVIEQAAEVVEEKIQTPTNDSDQPKEAETKEIVEDKTSKTAAESNSVNAESNKDSTTPDATKDKPAQTLDEALKPVAKGDDKGAKWYIVHTYSGHENKVSKNLKQRIQALGFEDRIFDVLVPIRSTIKVTSGKKESVNEKIFPGYVLVKMVLDNESWLLVRTTQGVTSFIGAGNKPTPISEKEVEAIQKFMGTEEPLYKTAFTMGEAVKIVDGPFADFLGTIDEIDEAKGKVKVLVSIFGRETPVELDFLQVSKL